MRIFNKMKKTMLVLAASLFCANVAFAEVKTGSYAVVAGDIASGAQITSVEGITMTFGTSDTWTSGSGKATVNGTDFNVYATTGENVSPSNGKIPTAGPYVVFTPQFNGTVTGIVSNAGETKNGYIVKDEDDNLVNGTVLIDGVDVAWVSGTPYNSADKYNGGVTFEVEAGSTYYFYMSGSKMRFNGFIYTYDDAPATPALDLTACNEAIAWANAEKAKLNAEDETEAMVISEIDNAVMGFQEMLENLEEYEITAQEELDNLAAMLKEQVQGYIDMIPALKLQPVADQTMEEGWALYDSYPEDIRTDEAGLGAALQALRRSVTQENIDAVKAAMEAFKAENDANMAGGDAETVELTEDLFKEWDKVGADAQVIGDATSEMGIGKEIGGGAMVYGASTVDPLLYADLSAYEKMIIEGTPGMVIRVLMNRELGGEPGSFSGALVEVKPAIGEDGKAEVDFTTYDYVHLNAMKTDWGGASGTISKISLVKAAEPEVPVADSLKIGEVTILAAGKTYVLGKSYEMFDVQFTAEKDGFLTIAPSQKISSTNLKINGASSTFTKDANNGISKKGMAAGSVFAGRFYCSGTPSAENVYELVVTFEEGVPYSPLALKLASPADGGEWSGAAQYKTYGTKGVPHYEFSTLIGTDVKASVKIGEKIYENIKLTVDGYNPNLDITALPDTLNKAIAAGLIKAGDTFTLTLSNIVDKEFAANTLADQTFTYTLASTACTGVSPTPSTSRTAPLTDVTFAFDGKVALADTAKFYMVNLANNEVTELTGEVVEETNVKVTVPAIEGLLPRLYNIVAEGVTDAEGKKVITYGTEPGKLVASYGTGNGFFKGVTSLQNWAQVYSLKGFTATYPGEVIAVEGIATKPITFTKVNVNTGAEEEMPGVTLGYTVNGNVIEFALSEAITEVGTYRFSVPQKHFWAKDTYTEEDAKLSTPKFGYYQASITLTIDVVEPTATDVTSKLVNPTVDENANGWTTTTGGDGGNKLATNKVDGKVFTGKFLENWRTSSNPLNGDIYQEITGLSAGTYKVTMGAFSEDQAKGTAGSKTWVFANDSLSLEVNTAVPTVYSVYTELAEGATLKLGLRINAGANWAGFDNVQLAYYGEGTTVDMALKADWKVLLAAVAELKAAYAEPIEVEALDAAVAAAKIGTAQEYLASAKAVNEAMAAFKKVNDAEVAYKALVATLEGATADAPVDATGFIANPSFAGGKYNCDNGTGNGNINAPEDWTVTYTNADWGWKNFQPATGGGQDGDQFFEFWAATYHTLTLGQEVRLPAGSYVVSAALRTERADQVTSQHVYVKIGEDVDSSAVLGAPIGDSWNAANAWQTLSVAFSIEEETVVTIGAGSTGGAGSAGWFQIDNFRLSCTGWVDPALGLAVDSLNALIAEVEAYQKTLDLTDPMQNTMNGELTTAIADAKAVAEAKESVAAVNTARGQLNSVYVAVIGGITGSEVMAAEEVYASYTNPSDNAGLKAAIDKVYEVFSYIQTGMGGTAYTLKDLADAVEAMKVAKEAFIKENAPATEPVVKMTWVDYDQPTTAMGEIAAGATARAGYNKISDGSVAFANTAWGENKITYIQVDASCYTGDIVSAKLTVDVSGSTDSKRTTGWGIGYNSSVWSAGMTYETADKTITIMGAEQWTSTKSATTFETKTFDILDAFKNDADKVVTLVVYETAAAGGYIKNPVVAIEAANADEITTYTVKYVDEAGAEIADPFIANIMIGEKAALTAEDKADRYNADKTKKYIYVSSDKESIVTVADSASNVITATFREAAKYNYTVETTDDSGSLAITMGSYFGFEGENVKAPYYAYVLNEADSTLYQAAATNKEYNKYVDLTQDNMKVQVAYTPTTIKNIVYYQEAENVEGLTKVTTGNTSIRSSNSASAYAAESDVVLTTLAPGKYKLAAVIYDATKAMGAEFSFIAGTDTVFKAVSSAANWTNCVSEEFALTANTTLSLAKGGSSMQAVDLFYIQKTGDVELPAKVAYLCGATETTEAIYTALVESGYDVTPLNYDEVTLTEEVVANDFVGKYDVVVLAGATKSGSSLAATHNLLIGKVNVLSTKAFWYNKTTPAGTNGTNPGTKDAPSTGLVKVAGYEEHPIYAGIEGAEFAVFNESEAITNGRYFQGNGALSGIEQATIGTTLGANCIGEAWVDGKGWMIIPVDGDNSANFSLTADGAQLFVNAVDYLIAGEQFEYNLVEGVRVEATQWPADIYDLSGRMIKKAATSLEGLDKGLYFIQGKKVLVK